MNAKSHRAKKVFEVVFAFYSLFGMHFFMHNQGGAGLYLPFNMMAWALISVLIGVGCWHVTLSKKTIASQMQFLLLAGFIILLLPFLNSQAEWNLQAQPRFIAISAGLLLFFALSQFQFVERQRHGLLYLMLGAVAIEAIYGLVQFLILKDGNWLGYDVKINRPYGIFQQVNVYASFLASGFGIAFYLLRWDERLVTSRLKLFLVGFILIATPFLLVQVQSRAGIFGASLVLFCMLPMLWNHNRKLFFSAIALISVGLFVGFYVNTYIRSADSYTATVGLRKLYWSHVIDMWRSAPILGHGYGSFEYTFLHDFYAPENIKPSMRLMEENLDHPHNEVLFWLHEGGIVAVIGLVIFAAGYIRSLLKCAGWAKRISLLALVLPLLFHSMVEYPFYHSVAHFFLFIVFLWLADAESGLQKVYACSYWFLAWVVAIFIPLIVVPFMLTGLQAAYVLTKYDRMKDKNPQVLEQIINPLPWMMMYEFEMRNVQLTFSAAMHDKAGLESYVEWAKGFLHNTPRSIIYVRLVYALQELNDKEQAKSWLDEGKRLFPRADFLQNMSLSSGAVAFSAK